VRRAGEHESAGGWAAQRGPGEGASRLSRLSGPSGARAWGWRLGSSRATASPTPRPCPSHSGQVALARMSSSLVSALVGALSRSLSPSPTPTWRAPRWAPLPCAADRSVASHRALFGAARLRRRRGSGPAAGARAAPGTERTCSRVPAPHLQIPVTQPHADATQAHVRRRVRLQACRAVKQQFGSFDELLAGSDVPVLVDFYASWCGPCVMMAQTLAQVAPELKGRVKVFKVALARLCLRTRLTHMLTPLCFRRSTPRSMVRSPAASTSLACQRSFCSETARLWTALRASWTAPSSCRVSRASCRREAKLHVSKLRLAWNEMQAPSPVLCGSAAACALTRTQSTERPGDLCRVVGDTPEEQLRGECAAGAQCRVVPWQRPFD